MINKDSIVTAYDEHLTLVEWLQKVETALKDASAVSFKVNKRGDSTLTFSVVFEDGSELETAPIILQQGESVQGATIRNGHLIFTLTNGDELDAGDLGGVSGFSIDASQHLIVTYQNGTMQDLGAIFSGDINVDGALSTPILTSPNDEIKAQKPVIEVMNGYAFTKKSPSNATFDYKYFGAVKNGNKLTLSLLMDVTLTQEIGQGVPLEIGNITIPSSIGSKLKSSALGYISLNDVACSKSIAQAAKHINVILAKYANTTLGIIGYQLSNLEVGSLYSMRYEVTLLLSDNLAE